MSEENVSLPVAQALASALEKIEAYVPTEYVDNSEPDIDAEHLNHAEQGIMRVTNLLNAAVDVIQGQESRLSDAETNVGTDALTGGMTDLSSGVNSLYSNLKYLNGGYSTRITRIKNIQVNDYYVYIDLDTSDLPVNKKLSEYPMILVAVNTNTVAEPILYADRAGDRKIRVVFAGTVTGTINLCLQYSVSPV